MRLHRACAAVALEAGDRPRAAYHLAQAAELVNRGPGLMPEPVPPGTAARLIAEAAALAGGDPAAQARVVIAAGFDGARLDAVSAELAERGITLARRAGDPLGESAALDLQTSIQVAYGDIAAAAASALRRTELLAPLRRQALGCGIELFDAYQMAAETAVAAGDLAGARKLAEEVRDLPFYREEGHLATARLLVVTALAGDWDETAAFGERFREGWERAGRAGGQPQPGNVRGRGRVRAARRRRRPGGVAHGGGRARHSGQAARGRPSRRVLRRAGAAPRRPPGRRGDPAGHAAGGLPGLVQRALAALVRGAVGRGRGARR